MSGNTLRELLNRLRWSPEGHTEGVIVEVRTREAGIERVADVRFEAIVEVLPGGVTVADGTFLPYHRVVRVLRGNEVLWQTSTRVRS